MAITEFLLDCFWVCLVLLIEVKVVLSYFYGLTPLYKINDRLLEH